MAIFSVLGIALIALLRQSTAFLEKGQAGSELQDTLEGIDRTLAEDFANVYIRPGAFSPLPDVRFVCDRVPFDVDGDGNVDVWTQRLSFVRSVQGEAADPILRGSGSKAGAMGVLDGTDDSKEVEENDLRAPGGKEEVTWVLLPGKKDEEPGVMTLCRGVRMPPGGGKSSLLPAEPVTEKKKEDSRQGVTTRTEIEERLRPVQAGVLYVSYRFWSRHVKPESARFIVNDRLAEEVPPARGGGGLTPTWDSTRGILPLGTGPDQFFLSRSRDPLSRSTEPAAAGPGTLADPVDDVFPSRVRVVLVVDRVGKDASVGELTRTIGAEDSQIPVDGTRFSTGSDPASRFIKVDQEWIRWGTRGDRSFTVEERGARGTKKATHERGARVRAGSTLVREYAIPSFREDWND
jgi:hypothetical protein